ncbi:MAG TPA: hypothetical protein DCX53_03690 [Anaerolineae bacterium]|nr:hypothetical protein [Anaerolineae bacterium]
MVQKRLSPNVTLQNNIEMYDDYYQKPNWWFRFRYDTQVKRKTCLYLLHVAGRKLSDQRVLEIGFGSGVVLFSFRKDCEIYGLEISTSAIEQAKKQAHDIGYKKFEFQSISGDLLPYPDDFFDVLVASHVIEHVQNDELMLSEIARVLKPDGVAVVLIPINENYEDPHHLHRYSSVGFSELASSRGLRMSVKLENELLFHLVEKFYFEGYNRRWKYFGAVVAALFNFPTSILPFWVYRFIERGMMVMGWKPRQLGCVFTKI